MSDYRMYPSEWQGNDTIAAKMKELWPPQVQSKGEHNHDPLTCEECRALYLRGYELASLMFGPEVAPQTEATK